MDRVVKDPSRVVTDPFPDTRIVTGAALSFQNAVLEAVSRELGLSESHGQGIKTASSTMALIFAFTGVLYADLAMKDYEGHWYRWFLAFTSWFVNYVQIYIPSEETFYRYFNYFRSLFKAMHEEDGFNKLMSTSDLKPGWEKWLIILGKIGYFTTTEVIKLGALYFMSILPASLTEDTPDLDHPFWKWAFYVATFVFLESAVHERIHKIPWPAFTNYFVRNQNITILREVIDTMLQKNALRLRDNITSPQAEELVELARELNHDMTADHELLKLALAGIGQHDPTNQVLKQILTMSSAMLFNFLYSSSNWGVYRQIWRNSDDFTLAQRMGSNGGDALFGLFMSLRAAYLFVNAAYGRMAFYRIFSYRRPWNASGHLQSPIVLNPGYEWRETLLFWISVVISGTTFFSTLAVAKDENMPESVQTSTFFGTLFDNSAFLIELGTYLLTVWDLYKYAKRTSNKRYDRAVITTLFRKLRELLTELSGEEFVALFQEHFADEDREFDRHQLSHLYAALKWPKKHQYNGKDITDALDARSLSSGLPTLNLDGRHGVKRNLYEWAVALIAAAVVSLGFIPAHDMWKTFSRYGAPAMAVALPLGFTYFFDHSPPEAPNEKTHLLKKRKTNGHGKLVSKTSYCKHAWSLFSWLLASGAPILVKLATFAMTQWLALNVFDQKEDGTTISEEEAANISHITATAVTAVTAAAEVAECVWAFR